MLPFQNSHTILKSWLQIFSYRNAKANLELQKMWRYDINLKINFLFLKSALVSQSFDPKATQLEQFLIVWHDPVLYILLKKIQVLLGKYVCTYLLPKVGKYT